MREPYGDLRKSWKRIGRERRVAEGRKDSKSKEDGEENVPGSYDGHEGRKKQSHGAPETTTTRSNCLLGFSNIYIINTIACILLSRSRKASTTFML
jgi:hypothetical protein